jgi:hypothetical protein
MPGVVRCSHRRIRKIRLRNQRNHYPILRILKKIRLKKNSNRHRMIRSHR